MLRRSTRAVLIAGSLVAVLAGRLSRVEVRGRSMAPALEPGDRLLVWRTARVRPGDLVVVREPRPAGREVVKRAALLDAGGVHVLGDNAAASTDSRTYGPVTRSAVRGRPIYRYAPSERIGTLSRGRADGAGPRAAGCRRRRSPGSKFLPAD